MAPRGEVKHLFHRDSSYTVFWFLPSEIVNESGPFRLEACSHGYSGKPLFSQHG